MTERMLAIVNPAAGHGRCGRQATGALDRIRASGIPLDAEITTRPGHATELARAAYRRGTRRFLAVGGDGTACEIVNGLVPTNHSSAQLAFLPLGTGNSFLRDFTDRGGVDETIAAIARAAPRRCDVLRLAGDADRVIYAINQIGIGFIADVAATANRSYKGLGELGYVVAGLARTVALRQYSCPVRVDGEAAVDRRPALFWALGNSRYTGGRLLIAPRADTADGVVDLVRCDSIGRVRILRSLPTLFDGSHLALPFVSSRQARRLDFDVDEPLQVSIDGDVVSMRPTCLDVLPGAIQVLV
jgi:YegS/Rv2252/BmrU family lipid kinase